MEVSVLERIVETALETQVVDCAFPTVGSVAETALLELAGAPSQVVCKRGGANVWTGDVIEPLVCQAVAEATELPVPEVLATGSVRGPHIDPALERWALYEHREGDVLDTYPAHELATTRRIVRQAGSLLGRLHAAFEGRYDAVAGLARADGDLGPVPPAGWHAMAPDGITRGLIPVPTAGHPECRPVLTHGDYHPHNLLCDADGTVTAVLDWGNAHVTHDGYAVARAEARFVDRFRLPDRERSALIAAFRAGYEDHRPLEPAYGRRAPWYKRLWLVQSLANYGRIARTKRGRTQLARQARTLLE